MDQQTADYLRQEQQLIELFTMALPRLQPAALKHEYVTSVANVMVHPVAHELDTSGANVIIGWGDMQRTLPLVLIRENDAVQSVRHAFVPNLNDPRQARLVNALQREENTWAPAHQTTPRDIAGQLRYQSANQTNVHGINAHSPRPTYTKEQEDQLLRERWYPTDYVPPTQNISHHGPVTADNPRSDDYAIITENLTDAANMASNSTKQVEATRIGLTAARTVKVTAMKISDRFADTTRDNPTDDGPDY